MDYKDVKPIGLMTLKHAKSKKSGEFYTALVLDFGYKKKFLNLSFSDIAEFLDLKPSELLDFCDKQGEFEKILFP